MENKEPTYIVVSASGVSTRCWNISNQIIGEVVAFSYSEKYANLICELLNERDGEVKDKR